MGGGTCVYPLDGVLQLHRASCLDKLGDQAAMVSGPPARARTQRVYSDLDLCF